MPISSARTCACAPPIRRSCPSTGRRRAGEFPPSTSWSSGWAARVRRSPSTSRSRARARPSAWRSAARCGGSSPCSRRRAGDSRPAPRCAPCARSPSTMAGSPTRCAAWGSRAVTSDPHVARPWLEHFPDLEHLTAQLGAALRDGGASAATVTVLERQRTAYASSSPSEIVTCRVGSRQGQGPGPTLQLYCKYGARHGRDAYSHRGDRRYEAAVYRDVLRPLGKSTPAFYGSATDERSGETLLVLEYLGPCPRVNETAAPEAMSLAARWIGE